MRNRTKVVLALIIICFISVAMYAQGVIPEPANVTSEDMLKKIGIQGVLLDSKDQYIAQLKQIILAKQSRIDELQAKCGDVCK